MRDLCRLGLFVFFKCLGILAGRYAVLYTEDRKSNHMFSSLNALPNNIET